MSLETKLGTKLRTVRRREGLTQTDLAARLDISASYLNLIEHNQRPLPAHLLVRAAQILKMDVAMLGDEGQVSLTADLQEIFGDPLFEEHEIGLGEVREVAEHSSVAKAILSLYQAYRESVEASRALSAKLYDGRDFAGVNPQHLPSEEVSDVIQVNMNYFPELEELAIAVAARAKLDRRDLYRSLSHYLLDRHEVTIELASVSRDGGAMRRFDPARRKLILSEALPPWSRNFQIAHQLGLIEGAAVMDRILARSASHLTTAESIRLCRIALANYFAGALLMPYEEFLALATELRYDVELLQHHYIASWEQVCHRLTSLRRPGAEGVPFHFVRVDIAGNISKRFSGTGIRFARFSGSCPRWDVHSAFLTPGRIRTQLSKMPDGTGYFCVARTIRRSNGGFASGESLMAVGIGCPVREARKLVYSDGYDLTNLDAAVPIGTSCRLCERLECDQRAFPPIQYGLTVDENFRGRSFYAPAASQRREQAAAVIPVKKRGRGKRV